MSGHFHGGQRQPPPSDILRSGTGISGVGLVQRKGIPAVKSVNGNSSTPKQQAKGVGTCSSLLISKNNASNKKEGRNGQRYNPPTEKDKNFWNRPWAVEAREPLYQRNHQHQDNQQRQQSEPQYVENAAQVNQFSQEVIRQRMGLQGSGKRLQDPRHQHQHVQSQQQAHQDPQQQDAGFGENHHAFVQHDMETGHYIVNPGTTIDRTPPFKNGRYKVVQLLGSGTYGKVVLCEDEKYQKALVAVKLVRNDPPIYRVAAANEIRILHQLNGHGNTVKLLRSFDHEGHVSMTFELLGESIWSLVHRNQRAFEMGRVRDVTLQMLQAIEYVHSHHIIHSDIKSENVLIASHPDHPGPLFVRLVDFGCALFSRAWHPPIAGTMSYRSLEAVLQAEWSYPVDLWGIGCVFVEMMIGRQMFELAHDDVHLHMIQQALGPIPAKILLRGWSSSSQRGLLAMGPDGSVHVAPCRPEGMQQIETVRPLNEWVTHPVAYDLARRFLEYDPVKRITAHDALRHEFFTITFQDDIDNAARAQALQEECQRAQKQVQSEATAVPKAPRRHYKSLDWRILLLSCASLTLLSIFGISILRLLSSSDSGSAHHH